MTVSSFNELNGSGGSGILPNRGIDVSGGVVLSKSSGTDTENELDLRYPQNAKELQDTQYEIIKEVRNLQKTAVTREVLKEALSGVVAQVGAALEPRFAAMDQRIGAMDQKIDTGLAAVNQKLDTGLAAMNQKIDAVLAAVAPQQAATQAGQVGHTVQ